MCCAPAPARCLLLSCPPSSLLLSCCFWLPVVVTRSHRSRSRDEKEVSQPASRAKASSERSKSSIVCLARGSILKTWGWFLLWCGGGGGGGGGSQLSFGQSSSSLSPEAVAIHREVGQNQFSRRIWSDRRTDTVHRSDRQAFPVFSSSSSSSFLFNFFIICEKNTNLLDVYLISFKNHEIYKFNLLYFKQNYNIIFLFI